MARATRKDLVRQLVGSVQILSSAVDELLQSQIRDVVGTDLTLSQIHLLKLVDATDPPRIGSVAEFLGVSNAAASKAVDRLVRRKLIRRREVPADRRAFRLSLSAAGKRVLSRFEKAREKALQGAFARVSGRALEATAKTLDQMSVRVVDQYEEPGDVCLRCGIFYRDSCVIREATKRTCYRDLAWRRE
jgi:DNA-binding MarR family transcriptional regulator